MSDTVNVSVVNFDQGLVIPCETVHDWVPHGERGTGNRERVYSRIPHKNSNWMTKSYKESEFNRSYYHNTDMKAKF